MPSISFLITLITVVAMETMMAAMIVIVTMVAAAAVKTACCLVAVGTVWCLAAGIIGLVFGVCIITVSPL